MREGTRRSLRARARKPVVVHLSRRLQRLLAIDRPPIVAGPRDPAQAAARAKLSYVLDDTPGIHRLKGHGGFHYTTPGGGAVPFAVLDRIKKLVIPPAWTDVWISPHADGHIQATGRDARGRKQYRYHPRWREVRDRSKFGRMIGFAAALPAIHRTVATHLRQQGLPRTKVIGAMVRLLEMTCIRIGCDEYARENHHFGLATLRDRHVTVTGENMVFRFLGKSGKAHTVRLRNRALAHVVQHCRAVPGPRLFQCVDQAGESHPVDSVHVNEYLREISGEDFTAKDFRTWAGTNFVAAQLFASPAPSSASEAKRQVLTAIDAAAERLGNTRSVCRASYVHPAVIDAFMEGRLGTAKHRHQPSGRAMGLTKLELATLKILRAAARPHKA